jgi:hypothetical protein
MREFELNGNKFVRGLYFINMNRLSTHNKYVLKEGKYIRQSAEDQELFSHRTHSEVNNSVEG